jgi:hypothetical protein
MGKAILLKLAVKFGEFYSCRGISITDEDSASSAGVAATATNAARRRFH